MAKTNLTSFGFRASLPSRANRDCEISCPSHSHYSQTPIQDQSDYEKESDSEVFDDDDDVEEICNDIGKNQDERVDQGDQRVVAEAVNNETSEATRVMVTKAGLLDCPICHDPLSQNIYQCKKGHIVCSICRIIVKTKCQLCILPGKFTRCRVMEKLMESIRVDCKNKPFGCNETLKYHEKVTHEKICLHTECFCPFSSCTFSSSSKNLYAHFRIYHSASAALFSYTEAFNVLFKSSQKLAILQELDENVIFILNQEIKEHGRVFNVDCVGPESYNNVFVYQLTVKSRGASLSLECTPDVYAKWEPHNISKNYLTVPSDFVPNMGPFHINICIKKA